MQVKDLQLKRALHTVLFVLLLNVVGMEKMYAYDFSAVCATGQTLYYNITDATNYYVELTYPGSDQYSGWSGFTEPTGDITLPSSVDYSEISYIVTAIGECAFYHCWELTDVVIPNTVLSIGSAAFYACTSLESITFGDAVVFIGSGAFEQCYSLTSINFPNSLLTIGESAFSYCDGLGAITIPNSVSSIGTSAFEGCMSLGTIVVENGNAVYDSRNSCNAIIETLSNTLIVGCRATTIPASVAAIGNRAFADCRSLYSIDIPNSVTSIRDCAFLLCRELRSIFIPSSVSYLAQNAFGWCEHLENIEVDEANPFYDSRNDCNAIIETQTNMLYLGCKNTIIPNTVASIGDNAFSYCYELTSIDIPNSVTSIGNRAFEECTNLTLSEIPNSVISIGDYAFSGCTELTLSEIPNSVVSIGNYAFNYCHQLFSITIGKSVETIGSEAFAGCHNLATVNMLPISIPVLGTINGFNGAFNGTSSNLIIYVPYESLNEYKTATYWSNYVSRIFPMAYTTIVGYGEGNGNWQFIASPLIWNTIPTEINDIVTTTSTYDLYRFNQSAALEWENYKAHTNYFPLVNGKGYLYANAKDVNLIFKGVFNEDETKEVNLVYDAGMPLAGWNLVGNPFPVNAYANRSYYVMNQDGTAIEPVAVSMETAIPVCTGVMVKADNAGETVTFSKTVPEMVPNQGNIQIAVMQTNKSGVSMMDKAIVSFNAGDKLEKFVFNEDNAQLYIPSGNTNYAIACAKKTGEMPLNFKAHKNGIYTITVDAEKTEMEYLHIIDNLTGADVDLLAEPNYTFEARPTDYASRFKLVFSANEEDGASTGSETFAFVNNGNIIITTDAFDASLQVIDMLGRVLVCRDARSASAISTTGMPPGVYVLRLINGDDVRTQKIVVR